MTTSEKTEKRGRGRIPAKLNINKPGVGMAYIAMNIKGGKAHTIRIATTCARDTNPAKNGELKCMLSNYTSGGPNGEKYFTAKIGRKKSKDNKFGFRYFVFLCDERHKKCMGFEAKADEIPNKIEKVMKELAKAGAKTDDQDRLIITDFVEGILDYQWLDISYANAKANGTKVYKMVDDGFELISEDGEQVKARTAKPVKKAKVEKTEKKVKAKVETEKPAKVEKKAKVATEKPAVAVAKESGAVKKTDNRKTWYGIKDGKVVTRRVVTKPEGFFATREEADASLDAAVKLLNTQVEASDQVETPAAE